MSKMIRQPLSYRHLYHAGNHGDVLKHSVMACLIGSSLRRHHDGTVYIDTHAGPGGVYDLESDYAQKKAEYKTGVGRVYDLSRLAAMNPHITQPSKLKLLVDQQNTAPTTSKLTFEGIDMKPTTNEKEALYLRLFAPASDIYSHVPRINGYGCPGAEHTHLKETLDKDDEEFTTELLTTPIPATTKEFCNEPLAYFSIAEKNKFKKTHRNALFLISVTGDVKIVGTQVGKKGKGGKKASVSKRDAARANSDKASKEDVEEEDDIGDDDVIALADGAVLKTMRALTPGELVMVMANAHKEDSVATTTSPTTLTINAFVRWHLPLPPSILPYLAVVQAANTPKDLSTVMELPDPDNLPLTIIDRYNVNPYKLKKFADRARKREKLGSFYTAGRIGIQEKSDLMRALATQGVNTSLLPRDSRVGMQQEWSVDGLVAHARNVHKRSIKATTEVFANRGLVDATDEAHEESTGLEVGVAAAGMAAANIVGRVPLPLRSGSAADAHVADVNMAIPFFTSADKDTVKASDLLKKIEEIPKHRMRQMQYGGHKDLKGDSDVLDEYFDDAFSGAREREAKEHFEHRYEQSKAYSRSKGKFEAFREQRENENKKEYAGSRTGNDRKFKSSSSRGPSGSGSGNRRSMSTSPTDDMPLALHHRISAWSRARAAVWARACAEGRDVQGMANQALQATERSGNALSRGLGSGSMGVSSGMRLMGQNIANNAVRMMSIHRKKENYPDSGKSASKKNHEKDPTSFIHGGAAKSNAIDEGDYILSTNVWATLLEKNKSKKMNKHNHNNDTNAMDLLMQNSANHRTTNTNTNGSNTRGNAASRGASTRDSTANMRDGARNSGNNEHYRDNKKEYKGTKPQFTSKHANAMANNGMTSTPTSSSSSSAVSSAFEAMDATPSVVVADEELDIDVDDLLSPENIDKTIDNKTYKGGKGAYRYSATDPRSKTSRRGNNDDVDEDDVDSIPDVYEHGEIPGSITVSGLNYSGSRGPTGEKLDTRAQRRRFRKRVDEVAEVFQDDALAGMTMWPGAAAAVPLYQLAKPDATQIPETRKQVKTVSYDWPATAFGSIRFDASANTQNVVDLDMNMVKIESAGQADVAARESLGVEVHVDRALSLAPSSPFLFSSSMRPKKDRLFLTELHSSEYAVLLDNHANPSLGQTFARKDAESRARSEYIAYKDRVDPSRPLFVRMKERDMKGTTAESGIGTENPFDSELLAKKNKALAQLIDGFVIRGSNHGEDEHVDRNAVKMFDELNDEITVQKQSPHFDSYDGENAEDDIVLGTGADGEVVSVGGGVAVLRKDGFKSLRKMVRRYQNLNEQYRRIYRNILTANRQDAFRTRFSDNSIPARAKVSPGMVLIDPAYEGAHEFASAVDAVRNTLLAWPNACVSVWYPIIKDGVLLKSEQRAAEAVNTSGGRTQTLTAEEQERKNQEENFVPRESHATPNPTQDNFFLEAVRREFEKHPRYKHRSLFLDLVRRVLRSREVKEAQNSEFNYNFYAQHEREEMDRLVATVSGYSRGRDAYNRLGDNADRMKDGYKTLPGSSYHTVQGDNMNAVVAEVYSQTEDDNNSSVTIGSGMLVVNAPEPEHLQWQLNSLVPWLSSALCESAPATVAEMEKHRLKGTEIPEKPVGEYALEWF